ncbi:MAG: hypothetical protein H6Q03_3080 [Acidobacteria bacterium]|nr:hypothetical protein [Acidobacteriota bacterium]
MRLCPAAVLLPALLATHLAAPPGRADPLPAAAEKVVDYEISVRLEPETQLLTGSERLTWRNPSSCAATARARTAGAGSTSRR